MVTKNEAENIMEEAIGSQIADYLIKPVNPNQLLLTIKKLIDNKRLVSEKNSLDYQIAFRQLFMEISEKYKGDKDAAQKIAANITMGGAFGWEFGEMPAKGLNANDAEIQSLSKFIADLAK